MSQEEFRKRCRRYDVAGHCHYLTFSCYHRQPLLMDAVACRWLCDAIDLARFKTGFDLLAFVIMPEHVHALVWPHEGVRISEILRLMKLPVARRSLLAARRSMAAGLPGHVSEPYHFWQRGGGYDRNLWHQTELREKINYIHANPVRRGLVKHPKFWPWSSWRAWHSDGCEEPLRIDRSSPALF